MGSSPLANREQLIRGMCESMTHRGPDDSGTFVSDEVALGQARLSIIDLPGGHQPLSNEDATVWVTFNGEIYNYKELRSELSKTHRLTTLGDTEVLVHLYEDFGINMVKRLNGMFAFGLWDARLHSLFLVRDRLGIKPLYYAMYDGRVAFASELKALLRLPFVPRDLDAEALAEYLTLGYITDPHTPFAHIRKLSCGSILEIHEGQATERRYWEVPVPESDSKASLDDLCEEIRALLEDATRLQLRADVPVGVFASGGIDSTAIMWAASRQGVSLEAFLCEFDDLKKDTPYARVAAAATGMRLTESQLSQADAGRLLPHLVWHLDEPHADPSLIPCYMIAREAAAHVKVILNGTGGDELFGGYARYAVRGAVPAKWSARSGRVISRFANSHSMARKLAAGLDFRHRYVRRMSMVLPETEARTALGLPAQGGKVERMTDALFAQAASSDPAGAMMHVDLNVYLPGDLLMLLDKMTMAVSLESRVPLLDHRLVEFAARLPGALKMQGGELKFLLRRALRKHVPDAILDRPKQGFGPPVASWMRAELGADAIQLLTHSDSRVGELMGRDRIGAWIRAGRTDISRTDAIRLWALLVLELWLRTFVDGEDLRDADVGSLAGAGGARWT
ncbi:MAG: asparagine synthase (glutamine-hydrolyzing) [Anaerolineae bacterium]|nr:asparagine synthase (glutamine-hydrolyzing) [Gemmatimonadaceae bacterium]